MQTYWVGLLVSSGGAPRQWGTFRSYCNQVKPQYLPPFVSSIPIVPYPTTDVREVAQASPQTQSEGLPKNIPGSAIIRVRCKHIGQASSPDEVPLVGGECLGYTIIK